MSHTVLVTGVARHIGARVASVLAADPGIDRVIGVDTVPPPSRGQDGGVAMSRTEFVRVDLRSPDIARVIAAADVDTVVHVSLVSAPSRGSGRTYMKEHNVIGTMQLLGACQRSPLVRRLVVRSTTAVYGSSPRDPAVFTEDVEPPEAPSHGYAKDAAEVEGYVRGFARRRPDVTVTTLRFANFMGPGVDSPLTRYFTQPVLPTVLGFDPRLQFVHEDDGVEVLRRMATEDHPGTFNVAGDGVLLLSQCVRRAGQLSLPIPSPAFSVLGDLARRTGLVDFSPEQLRLMCHGRVVDTSALVAELGWRPKYTTAAAFDDFLRSRGLPGRLPTAVFDWLTEKAGVRR
ncbi:NAD-dependent epimerase/dehydratase family protein [Thermostaphylospora chromogena]|uniref:UDP-glucose 4-epimerase n=1 Tax=Thermostaphylospora chromogena TaxID=35622 RepID=A0A1H1DGL7_9ACTN|nr:NAD-dependent epimerase/dehydratase family protein [Thermostaphylospora chromogena]SDQ75348.1 UDP-glucose 4-epimerase [Thermostaphylospora chromogena]HLT11610.1 NAD-dependent epimerase/dehydratase family protein [Micromonosporaceae bacterium]